MDYNSTSKAGRVQLVLVSRSLHTMIKYARRQGRRKMRNFSPASSSSVRSCCLLLRLRLRLLFICLKNPLTANSPPPRLPRLPTPEFDWNFSYPLSPNEVLRQRQLKHLCIRKERKFSARIQYFFDNFDGSYSIIYHYEGKRLAKIIAAIFLHCGADLMNFCILKRPGQSGYLLLLRRRRRQLAWSHSGASSSSSVAKTRFSRLNGARRQCMRRKYTSL